MPDVLGRLSQMWGPKCEKFVKAMGFAVQALELEYVHV